MEKMIITATGANSWINPELKNWPDPNDVDAIVADSVANYEAGASILHVHLPRGHEVETVQKIRDHCDAIIQAGMSSQSIPTRKGDFESKPDMLSIILNHHAEEFTGSTFDVLHPLSELEEYCVKCKAEKIQPEWEVWHMGSIWNLNYLFDKGLIDRPQVLTQFFNWPGGAWSPPTADEFLHRIKYIPEGCFYTVSTMGESQTKIATLAISHGGNVRVGTEDYPFIKPGVPAKNSAELVSRMARISREMDREIADPTEARKILCLK